MRPQAGHRQFGFKVITSPPPDHGSDVTTDGSDAFPRIDETLEREANSVLSEIGLTIPDAVRLMLARVVEERRLPFDLKPNELTAETLRGSERGEDVVYPDDATALFRDLGM